MPRSPCRAASGSSAGTDHSTLSPLRKGMPRRSVGSICDKRMSISRTPCARATCSTILDLPTPGGPHSITGVCVAPAVLANSRSSMAATWEGRTLSVPRGERALDRAHVETELTLLPVAVIMSERIAHGRERDVAPRHFAFAEKPRLERLGARAEIEIEEPRAKQHV